MNLKKKFKKAVRVGLAVLTAVSVFTITPNFTGNEAVTTINAADDSDVFRAIQGLTDVDLSNPATWEGLTNSWGNGTRSGYLPSPKYGTSVGSDVATVTSADYSSIKNKTFDCVRFSLAVTGHAIKEGGGNPTDYITQIGYSFNGNGRFGVTTDWTSAQAGDLLVFGSSAHISVALGWYNGYFYTISGSSSGKGPIIKAFAAGTTPVASSGGGSNTALSYVYTMPHNKQITVNVTKQSLCENVTNGNPLYSLEGAEFVVKNGDTVLGTLRTNSKGVASGTYTVASSVNSVTVTETKAPNFYYLSDSSAHNVDVSSGVGNITIKDVPVTDPAEYDEQVVATAGYYSCSCGATK